MSIGLLALTAHVVSKVGKEKLMFAFEAAFCLFNRPAAAACNSRWSAWGPAWSSCWHGLTGFDGGLLVGMGSFGIPSVMIVREGDL